MWLEGDEQGDERDGDDSDQTTTGFLQLGLGFGSRWGRWLFYHIVQYPISSIMLFSIPYTYHIV